MIGRVLGTTADGLEGAIAGLVAGRVAEHQRLEYKSQLPGPEKGERREFARDVSAMANGGGGVIIIGIKERDDAASELTPVKLGDEVTRLSQIREGLIEPYLRLDIHEVPRDKGSRGFIVIDIPPSHRRPFAVAEGSLLGYYRRSGRNRHPLSEAEVAEMYRSRVERIESVTNRLDTLVASVRGPLGQLPPPVIYVAAVPLESYARLFRPDTEAIQRIRSINTSPVFGAPVGQVLFMNFRPRFKRLMMIDQYSTKSLQELGWIEIHDDGSFLGIITARARRRNPQADENPKANDLDWCFSDVRLTCQVVARLHALGLLAREFDIHGEVAIRAGVENFGHQAFLTTPPQSGRILRDTHEAPGPVETSLPASTEDLATGPTLLRVASLLLDDLMTAFGANRCYQLENDGSVLLNSWDAGWTSGIKTWAAKRGVTVVDSDG